jgi:hypothetical protein
MSTPCEILPGTISLAPQRLAMQPDQCEYRHVAGDLIVYAVALLALASLILVMRWVFSSSDRPSTGRKEHGPGANLGMLRPVLASAPRADALEAKNRLSEKGIRCSLSRIDAAHYDLLVFVQDLDQAKSTLEL